MEFNKIEEIFEYFGEESDMSEEELKIFEETLESWKKKNRVECEKKERSEKVIEYWKTYRGANTKIEFSNDDVEKFLTDYRKNFIGKKTEKDEQLLEILEKTQNHSEMSLYILERIREDLEDLCDDNPDEYFLELYKNYTKVVRNIKNLKNKTS